MDEVETEKCSDSDYSNVLFKGYKCLPIDIDLADPVVCCERVGNTLLLATATFKLIAFNLLIDTCSIVGEIATYNSWVRKCVISLDGALLAVLVDNLVYIYHITKNYAHITTFRPHNTTIITITWSGMLRPEQDQFLVSGSKDDKIHVWRADDIFRKSYHETKNCETPWMRLDCAAVLPHSVNSNALLGTGVLCIAVDREDKKIATGLMSSLIMMWDITSGKCFEQYRGACNPSFHICMYVCMYVCIFFL
jgi:WD40 repeat protein